MTKNPPCTTDFPHCTKCGSYALTNVFTDRRLPAQVSRCCGAEVSRHLCAFSHPVYEPPTKHNREEGNHRPCTEARSKREEPKSVATPRARGSHADCDHEATPAARRACRAQRKEA